MGLFSTGAENVDIGSMTMGVSASGMSGYRDQLKLSILVETKEKLQDVTGIQSSIDAGWQGESRDRFLEDFGVQIETIMDDLEAEYFDLEARLDELEDNYFKQDENMVAD